MFFSYIYMYIYIVLEPPLLLAKEISLHRPSILEQRYIYLFFFNIAQPKKGCWVSYPPFNQQKTTGVVCFFSSPKNFHPPTGHIHHLATATAAVAGPQAFASSRVHFCLAVLEKSNRRLKCWSQPALRNPPKKKGTKKSGLCFF